MQNFCCTENDVLKAGLPIYHIERTVQETGVIFQDQAHIIYVNSQIKDETALGKLMHDFFCTDSKDMYYPVLADRVWYFKENEKGVTTMCRAMEDMRNDTFHANSVEIALRILSSCKMSYEEISALVNLPVDEIKALDSKRSA